MKKAKKVRKFSKPAKKPQSEPVNVEVNVEVQENANCTDPDCGCNKPAPSATKGATKQEILAGVMLYQVKVMLSMIAEGDTSVALFIGKELGILVAKLVERYGGNARKAFDIGKELDESTTTFAEALAAVERTTAAMEAAQDARW